MRTCMRKFTYMRVYMRAHVNVFVLLRLNVKAQECRVHVFVKLQPLFKFSCNIKSVAIKSQLLLKILFLLKVSCY